MYHDTRHANMESIVSVGLLPGGIGGGRKICDTYFTAEKALGGSEVRSQASPESAVVVVHASKCIDAGVQLWTNPSVSILTSDIVRPQCMISVTSIDGSPMWSNSMQNAWWKNSQADRLPEEGVRCPPEARPIGAAATMLS